LNDSGKGFEQVGAPIGRGHGEPVGIFAGASRGAEGQKLARRGTFGQRREAQHHLITFNRDQIEPCQIGPELDAHLEKQIFNRFREGAKTVNKLFPQGIHFILRLKIGNAAVEIEALLLVRDIIERDAH